MIKTLRMLVVDDSQDDALLLAHNLRKDGCDLVFKRVDTAVAMKAALKDEIWDVIVCDYSMPGFDAPEALQIMQESGLDIPFIVVSGVVGEGTAVKMMKAGAHDYFRKENLTRLAQAIERELQDAIERKERKRAELEAVHLHQALRQHAEQLEETVAQRTAELTIALEKAQAADRLKSQFVSDVNHELRTPLSNIKLYLSLLEQGRPENQPRYFNVLNRESERLQRLIEEMLDLSRLDIGTVTANLVAADLNQLIADLVMDRGQLIKDKGLTLDFEPASDLPQALADPRMLFQVFANLLGNAINYTSSGGAITLCTGTAEFEGQEWVTVCIKDTGPGIREEDLPHIFERFYRGQVGRESGAPGTGLGLAICKEIMDRHNGRITVSSTVGKGSLFTIWLQIC